ncbi:MAG: HEAT repeat domain-containing protein [Planctomycetaceae bacterium]|nr:HEAT repeat domain-containing protein [Planctomycetaceae bacterium]MCA9043212.1 HEAT repeat domain-containing protein [Planctomycetaceae bacterium]
MTLKLSDNDKVTLVLRTMRTKFLVLLLVLASPLTGRADVIRLSQGGEFRGEFAKATQLDESAPATLETLDGIHITVAREDVAFSKARSRVVEEYYSKVRDADGSVESCWLLADWCRTHNLGDERAEQLRQILALEPDHEEARRILGYRKYNGKWMTRDEFMASQGYVQHKGKWITPQERDLREKTEAQREAESVWYPKVRLWVGWLANVDVHKQQAALAEFQQLKDPTALAALRNSMENHRDARIRKLYVNVLANLPDDAGAFGLIERCLFDADTEIRYFARNALKPSHYEAGLPLLVKALRSDENVVVRRAAVLLGDANNKQAIPALIEALVTTHIVQTQVPVNNGVSFGQSGNGNVSVLGPGQGTLPPDVALAARTGNLPYGANVQRQGFQRYQAVNVRVDVTNIEVLDALEKLTGKNLGFRERDWQLWWALQSA